MRLPRYFLAAACGGILSPFAAAQASPFLEFTIDGSNVFPSHEIREHAVVEVNGDNVLDVALLQGDHLSIAFDPGFTEGTIVVPGTFHGVASWSEDGNPLHATVVAVGAGSLRTITWSSSTGSFAQTDVFDAATQSAGHTAWVGAAMVRTGDLNNDGYPDLVGLAAGGGTLLAALYDPVAGAFVRVPSSSFAPTLFGTVLDVALFDGAGDGTDEIVVLSTAGLGVFDVNGMLLASHVATSSAGDLEVVWDSTTQAERFVWLQKFGANTWYLSLINGATFVTDQVLDVTGLDTRHLTSGDYDGNGYSDLALTNAAGDSVRVLKQRTSRDFALTPGSTRNVVIDDAPSGGLDSPAIMLDWDLDGDLDVAVAIASTASLFLARNDLIDHQDLAPKFLTLPFLDDEICMWRDQPPVGDEQLHFRFRAPMSPPGDLAGIAPMAAVQAYPPGATHLEVRLWTSRHITGSEYLTDALPTEGVLISFSAFTNFDGIGFMQAGLPFFRGADVFEDIQYLTTRYVTFDGTDVTRVWPHTSRYFFHEESNTIPYSTYLEGLGFTGEWTGIFDADYWGLGVAPPLIASHGNTGGGTTVAGSGDLGCVPDLPPSDPPADPVPDEDTTPPASPAG